MINAYDEENEEHEEHLHEFYKLVFDKEPDMTQINSKGRTMIEESLWKDIGFQGKDPRTDFRGGGHLSLLNLIYFLKHYREDWDELVKVTKEDQDLMWLTAISSINITHSLVIYFYMHKGDVAPNLTKL
jgi:hypothetical protein